MNKDEDVQFSHIVLETICPTVKPETNVPPPTKELSTHLSPKTKAETPRNCFPKAERI